MWNVSFRTTRRFLFLLVILAGLTVTAYTAYQIEVSSSTVLGQSPHHVRKHRMRAVRRRIEGVIQKTSPNPHVQGFATHGLPANSPSMPTLVPLPPSPPPSRTDRFFAGAAKVMTRSWGPNIFVWLPAISTDPNAGPTV